MHQLGEVLELIHTSRRRFRTARATGQTDNTVWRLWWAGDGHFRFERDGESGGFINVRAGPVWWVLEADGEAHTNEGDPNLSLGMQPEFGLLHTRSLLATAILQVLREEEVAGRRAAVLRATPRPGADHWRWWGFRRSTEPMEVPVDLERGIALGGFRFRVDEAAFDEEFGPEVFSRPYAPDHHPVQSGLQRPRQLSLEDARDRVSFPLLLPRRLPEGARLLQCLVDPADPPEWVGLSWAIDPGHRYALHIRQGPGVSREAARSRGREVLRGGIRLLVEEVDREGRSHMVLVERGGGWLEIDSDLPLELITEVALSMEKSL